MAGEMMSAEWEDFDILDPRLENGLVIEASAGTGKTFSVAAIVVRALSLDSSLRISQILVTTFTRNAAAELRDRIRRRLVSVESQLRANAPRDSDSLAVSLCGDNRLAYADNLARAIREFDTATISTIHSVCARILTIAGLPAVGDESSSDISELLNEVVNDMIISESLLGKQWDAGRLRNVVEERLRSPQSVLSFQPYVRANELHKNDQMRHLCDLVEKCVGIIREKTEQDPTFDDMLRRAAEVFADPYYSSVAVSFSQRFALAIIDEAQDTDKVQWCIFQKVFTAEDVQRKLIAVGDPKQAIYRFRGADVEAYLNVRDPQKIRTLRQNWRSDSALITALNQLFADQSFGEGINYVPVSAQPNAPVSAVQGTLPLTIINIGQTNNKQRIIKPAARRVREILEVVSIKRGEVIGPCELGDICVLVSSKASGRAIETELRRLGVSAVSSGTENVMEGEIAIAFRRLFEAMNKPYSISAIRLAASTVFFDKNLAEVGGLTDTEIEEIQLVLLKWGSIVRRSGVSALATTLRSTISIVECLVRGDDGERHETDFSHVVELLHSGSGGRGCSPSELLELFEELLRRDATSETVSRRIESDRDAVQIMTVHASKGLEFPVVVVTDLWKLNKPSRGARTFHRLIEGSDGQKERVIDVGAIIERDDKNGKVAKKIEEEDETRRLFYVAMTRAQHHVSLIVGSRVDGSKNDGGPRATDGLLDEGRFSSCEELVEIIPSVKIGIFDRYISKKTHNNNLETAPLPAPIVQSYQRMSFSSISKKHEGRQSNDVSLTDTSGGGFEDDDVISIRSGYATSDVALGVSQMPFARLVGGTYFGKVMHSVYEHVDFAVSDLYSEVSRVVDEIVSGALLKHHRSHIIDGVMLSLQTPLGGLLGNSTLSSIQKRDRLDELNFELALASLADAVMVSDVGKVLLQSLRDSNRQDDVMWHYSQELTSSAFDIPLVGIMNGSIDALLRVSTDSGQQLIVTDYKSNRLDTDGDDSLIAGYDRQSMMSEMAHHNYPLQALIYGVAVHRYVRWRVPNVALRPQVGGIAYFFIRGMVGPDTPTVDQDRHGVFTWVAPLGLWESLSNLFSGVKA